MARSVLVLGGGGFIGRSLCRSLSVAGWKVVSATRHPTEHGVPGVLNVVSTFDEKEHFIRLLAQSEWVIHAASNTTPSSSVARPQLDGNLRPTLALLEALQEVRCTKLLYISSGGTLYRESPWAIAENTVLMPRSYHKAGKAAAEHFIQAWLLQCGGAACILRPSNIYGPGQHPKSGFRIVPAAFQSMIDKQPLQIWGDGQSVRDYLYIDGLVALCHAAIANLPDQGLCTMNASSGIGVRLNDLLSLIDLVSDRVVVREYLPPRAIDMHHVVLDNDLARRELGWAPQTELRSGLINTWNWFESSRA